MAGITAPEYRVLVYKTSPTPEYDIYCSRQEEAMRLYNHYTESDWKCKACALWSRVSQSNILVMGKIPTE